MKTQNKVVLVTGAAVRIGAIIAKTLHQRGYHIILHYNGSASAAMALCQQLNNQREDSVVALQGDFTCKKQLRTLAQRAVKAWGTLYGLVNNAALFFPDGSPSVLKEQQDLLMACNVTAPLLLSEWLAPALKKQQGAIVNIGDIHGSKPLKGYKTYSASQAALLAITENLACSLAPHIRVNAVSPGPTLPPTGENALSETQYFDLQQKTLLERFTDPADVAQSVIFCLENNSLTGHNLVLDGGRRLKSSAEKNKKEDIF